MNLLPALRKPFRALLSAAIAAFCLGCAAQKSHPAHAEKRATVQDLDSLNRVAEHKDSVESNHFFYEQAFTEYRTRYPGVDKETYLRIAKGKDQDFCLFKKEPAQTCLDNGDKFNDLSLKEPARDAYQAGLLSEGYNAPQQNIRLWASMGQLAVEAKEFDQGKTFLMKVLEVEPKNKWAKKLLASLPKNKG
jgi:hypothetical protein